MLHQMISPSVPSGLARALMVARSVAAGDIVDRVIAQAIEVLQRGATIVKANST